MTSTWSSELGRRVVHGFAWTLAQNAASRVISLVNQLVLAAILSPADFGLIGLTFSFNGIAASLIEVGVQDVVLQRAKAFRLWLGSVFWISLGLSVLAGLMLLLASPIAGYLYGSPTLAYLIAFAGIAMPVGSISTVPGLIMRARMQFGFLSSYNVVELIAQACMTIPMARAGLGAFSFILPLPITAAVRGVIWWSVLDSHVSLRVRVGRWKFLVRYTATSAATRLLIALIAQGDYIVLGFFADKSAVGAYYFAFRLAVQPLWAVAGNFINVLYPALAQIDAGSSRERNAVWGATRLLSYTVIPLGFLQAAVAGPAIHVLFHDKWASSVPIIAVLSIGLALDSPSWAAETFLRARGDFVGIFRAFAWQALVFFALVLLGAWIGQVIGVAVAVATYYAITQPLFVYRALSKLDVPKMEIALLYLKPISLSLLAVAVGFAITIGQAAVLKLVAIPLIAIPAYALVLMLIAPEVWTELVSRVRRSL